MKKNTLFFILFFVLLLAVAAKAELSSNLQISREYKPNTNLITKETYINSQGNPVVASDKGYASVIFYYNGANLLTEKQFLNAAGDPVNCTEGYACVQYTYQQRNIIKTVYQDASEHYVIGPEGYAVQEIKRGARGVAKETLEYDAEEHLLRHGITEYVDEQKSNLIKSQTWYDEQDKLTEGPEGYARAVYEYNKRKKSHAAYYNPDGSLFFNKKDGYAEMEEVYEKGVLKEQNYYGEGRQLIAGPKGFAKATYAYAQNGDETLTMYYNADGGPYFTSKGYCGIKQLYKNKKVVDESYYEGEGKRGYSTDGYSRTTRQYTIWRTIGCQCYYDDQDNLMCPENIGYAKIKNIYNSRYLIRTEYYGENNKLMLGPDGYAVVEHKYENQLKTEDIYYDTDGKTIINNNNGYARIAYQYNDDKQCNVQTYYDAEGKQVLVSGEADEVRLVWNDEQLIGESYWKDGQAAVCEKGYHEVKREYATNGKIKKEFYYDTNGQLTKSTDGYAGIEKLYNSKGKEMATLYYNEAGELMLTPGKEYAYVQTIPEEDKIALAEEQQEDKTEDESTEEETEETETSETASTKYIEYYGTDRELMNLSAGYAYVIRQADTQGRTIRDNYYDKDGNKAVLKYGYDELRQEYENSKKPSRTEYYLEGKPVLYNDSYAAVEREYDEAGNIITEWYFDTDLRFAACKNGYEVIRKMYNEDNRVVAEAYYDHTDQPMTNKKGVYRTAYDYNENGKIAKEAYFDAEGNPMLCQDGYAGMEKMYNTQGGTSATLYYNANGELIQTPGKEYAYVLTASKAEKEGTVEEESSATKTVYIEFYGTDRKLMKQASGYAAVIRTTDEQGRSIDEIYLDENGSKTLLKGEYDEVRQEYKENKKPSKIEYYQNGEPALRAEGYAAIERAYDEKGNITVEWYYGKDLEPTTCKKGYEMIRKEYNQENRVSREVYYDHEGNPMMNKNEVYQTCYEYNAMGKITREIYYDAEEKPMASKNGSFIVERTYDEEGNKVSETNFYVYNQ